MNKNQNVFCKQFQNTVKRHFNCRYLIKCHFTIEAPCLTVGYTGIQFNFKTHFYQMSLGPAHVHFTVFIPDPEPDLIRTKMRVPVLDYMHSNPV